MRTWAIRRVPVLATLIFLAALRTLAQTPNTINTIVGGGTQPTSASAAFLPDFGAVVKDIAGNVYISAAQLNVVYKVSSQGQLSIYAGTGIAGFSGDGGSATAAELNAPAGLALDSGQNLYIADAINNRIRVVNATTGVITTFAGSGTQYDGVGFYGGYSGDGGPATSALLNLPYSLAFDNNGNLFVGDAGNNVIRRIDNSAQNIITTYAGDGQAGIPGTANGDGGRATSAQLCAYVGEILGVATDASGNLYIADAGDSVVRKVDTSASHIITTYAGSISHTFTFSGNGGAANQAGLNTPWGVAVDGSGDLLIADTFNGQVRRVDTTPSHIITTIAGGNGACLSLTSGCGDGGAATSASLNRPEALFVDGAGNLLVYDYGTSTVRLVSAGGSSLISTFAGDGTGGLGGAGTSAILSSPYTVAGDSSGNLFVLNNVSVDRYDSGSKTLGAYAGNGVEGTNLGPGNGDGGPAAQANFFLPFDLALDASDNLYVGDYRLWVRRIDATTKTITTYAGTGASCNTTATPGCGDGGSASSATFQGIGGLATDSAGNLYIADYSLNRIRRVDVTTGIITNYAGTGSAGYTGDNGPATSATFSSPIGIAFDSQNNLYVADAGNNVIRKIDNTASHIITTYAFNGQPTFGGDGGSALSASMQYPEQVALDANGNLFVGGGLDNIVRRIDAGDQTVITVAGDVHNLDGGFAGDGGPSTQALLSNYGVAVDGNENLYIADAGNNRIRNVHLAPVAVVDSTLLVPFGPVLPGTAPTSEQVTITNNGLDDLVLTNIAVPANFLVTNECINNVGLATASLSPQNSCFLFVTFDAPANATAGEMFTGNLTFTTNDPANPSISLPLSATVGGTPGVTLTVSEAGLGSGTVTSEPSAIACPTMCTANFAVGQQVVLEAASAAGSMLTGWMVNGSTTVCPGTTITCTVTMSAAVNVVAAFSPASITVSGMGNGSGTITSSPAGIDCTITNGTPSGTCTYSSFPSGTETVTLTATPTGTSTFAGWLGYCASLLSAGTGPCAFPLAEESLITLGGPLATAVFSGQPQSFSQGQVFVGSLSGMIFVYNSNGTLAQVLNSGNLAGEIYGMYFDATGNLYAANPLASGLTSGTVEFFGNNGSGPTTFGTYANARPTDVILDPSGNVFVSELGGQMLSLSKFANAENGAPTSTFYPALTSAVSDVNGQFIELLSDGESMLYGTGGNSIGDFDIQYNHQNPDFATNLPGTGAIQIRELSDKSVLVADTTEVVRINSAGSVIQTYTPGGSGVFYALALNVDGLSFWTVDVLSGKVYRVRISDGTVLNTISTGVAGATSGYSLGGIAVLGQPQPGGADVSVSMTSAPGTLAGGSSLTYTITVTNNGPGNALSVAMTDAFPSGVAFLSSATSLGTCSGTTVVTCTLGTMTSGQTATMTIVVKPLLTGTLLNTVNATSTTPDPNDTNNSVSTSTTVTSNAVTLSVGQGGTGVGSVTSNPSGITCQPSCTSSFPQGSSVTLTATPGVGSSFAGWSGACTGTGPCVVQMTGNESVIANFALTGSTACNASGAAIWTGGASGTWNTASNWSTDSIPNSATAVVCIDDGGSAAAVTINSSVTVGTIFIDSGSSVTITDHQELEVINSIFNAGQINVAANGNQTNLGMGGAVTLTGGGSIVMTVGGNGGVPVIRSDAGTSGTLTNVNNVISGRGQLGNANLTFTNQAGAVVNANISGQTLLLDTVGTAVNQGLFESSGGGLLQISVTMNNSGGTISGGNGSQVQFTSGADIQAGTLSTAAGAGFFGAQNGNSVILDGTTVGVLNNSGTFTVADHADTELLGTINNTGSFQVAANGNQTNLSMGDAVTLTGAGSVVMSIGGNGGTPVVRSDAAGASLTNVNNTISGVGQIGNANLPVTSQSSGVVNATGNALLVNATQFVNQGLLEATAGGTLQANTLINNTGGNISATGSGATVQFLSGTTVQSGTLNTLNGAAFLGIANGNTVTLDGATHGTLNNTATFTIADHADADLFGTINNTGNFQVAANGNQTNLSMGNPVTLLGGGSVVMTVGGNGGVPVIRSDAGGAASLTNVNNVISGRGQIGNANLSFTNQLGGLVNANISGQALLLNSTTTVNQGAFESTGGGILQISVAVNNSGGTITGGSGAQVQFLSGADIQAGLLSTASGVGFFGAENGDTVILDGSSQGALSNAAIFTIADHADTQLMGTISNTGSFLVAANGNQTNLSMRNSVTLAGGGSVVMSIGGNGGIPVIRAGIGGASLSNANNAISGVGQLGNANLLFTNQSAGTVNANVSGGTLLINPIGTPVNLGLLASSNGGILQFDVTVNNAGGTISAASGSQVQLLSASTIRGGTVNSAAGSTFFGAVNGNATVLDGSTLGPLTMTGAFTIADHADMELLGTILNTGSIQVAANGNQTNLGMGNAVTLTGGGSVLMTVGGNGGIPVIRADVGGSSLTNVNNTFSGRGQIGNANLAFTNQSGGTVNASNSGNVLLVNTVAATNQGLFESTGGGILQISVPVNDSGGTIVAGAGGSQVQLVTGADIQAGTLNTLTGAGFFGTVNGNTVTLDGVTQGPIANTGTFTVADHGDTELMGTISNSGSIQISANGNQTNLSAVGAVTLSGTGSVSMSIGGNGGTPVIRQDAGGSSLTNAGNAISGPGQLTLPTYAETAGSIQIPSGVSDSLTSFAVSGGDVQVDGTLSVTNGVFTSGTGTISGIGSVSSGISNSGVTQAGDIPAPGILSVASLTQSSSGSYGVAIGGLSVGSQYSQLKVTGTASLAGALNISLPGGFTPAAGNSFTILTAGSITGTFTSINSPSLPSGLSWSVAYNATSVVLSVSQASPPSFRLTIGEPGSGSGTVTDNLGQIDCTDTAGVVTGTCSASYQSGTVVVLTATPAVGSTFGGWSACSGTGTCSVTMNSNQTVQATFGIVTPNFTLTVSELGTGTGTVTDNTDQINCSEANGVSTGTCFASYPSGTQVVLTASATSPATFGGWGNACSSSGTGATCGLTITATTNVTANFVPPPASVNLTFNPGTTVTQQATYDCPSGTHPCTDPNAHSLNLQLPQVNGAFTLTVTATEIPPSQADGLCETGNTVANDFDCRFVTFFSAGTDPNGSTIVPLCYPYANGNCVHYQVYSGTPGTEPDPSLYTGPVDWQIAFNNDTFVPPGPYWTGSQPQFYDDPDYAPTPTSAVGSVCTQPMTINGVAQNYFCQFEFDITTFINPTQPVDTVIGGLTKQLNDVTIAFPPSTSGQLTVTSTPDAASTGAGQPIGFTIAVNNNSPNTATGVLVSDPLPSGVKWTFTQTGAAGKCGITGGGTLLCTFGNLAPGTGGSLHVTALSAPAGTYVNAATVTVNGQQFLTITSITVEAVATSFSGLTPSQSITVGAASINLAGMISGAGPAYPPTGETISVTINGATQTASIGANGSFNLVFPTASIPASSTPYAIKYSYLGDSTFASAADSSTALTVQKAVSTTVITSTSPNPSTAGQAVTIAVQVTGSSTPTGTVQVTASTGETCTATLLSGSGSCSITFTTAGPRTFTAVYSGDSTFTGGTSPTVSQTVNSPSSSTVKISPSSINFGSVYVGTLSSKVVTVTNTGNTPVTVNKVSISPVTGGDSRDFAPLSLCLLPLKPGQSCIISVTLIPDASTPAQRAATLLIADTASGSPQSVSLTGTMLNPQARLSTVFEQFGNQKTNSTSQPKIVTLTNSGTTPLNIKTISLSGNFALAGATTCANGGTIQPSAMCTLAITFTPRSKGINRGSVTISDNALLNPQIIVLSGTGN